MYARQQLKNPAWWTKEAISATISAKILKVQKTFKKLGKIIDMHEKLLLLWNIITYYYDYPYLDWFISEYKVYHGIFARK